MPDAVLHEARLAELARLLESHMGWSLCASGPQQLAHSLHGMARHLGLTDAGACLEWLTAQPWSAEKADCCARFMTVGETYFFRERRGFDQIVACAHARAADPLRAGTPLRVWSAGCSTGEEPYSAAMAMMEAFPGLAPGAVSILATDVNERNMEAARAGVYRNWSFRGVPERIRTRYFSPAGDGLLRIADPVRAMVHFARLNLALPCYPSPANGTANVDVILCRNVLMYFTPAQRRLVVQRLRASLADGGWLVVNASEASGELFEGFTATCYPDAIHYQKTQETQPAPHPLRRHVPEHAAAPVAPRRAAPRTGQGREQGPPVPDASGAETLEQLRARAAHALAAGDTGRARACLQHIIYMEPLDVAAHYMMGIALEQAGRKAQGRRKFEVVAHLLQGVADADSVPGTDGLPAGYLRASLRTLLDGGARA